MGWVGCAQAVSQLMGKSGEKKAQKIPNQGTAVVQYSLCTGNWLCVKPGGKGVHEWLIPHQQPVKCLLLVTAAPGWASSAAVVSFP